jgi:putative intracellular protease/amidase
MRKNFNLLFSTVLVLFALVFAAASSGFGQSPFSSVKMELTLVREATEWKAEAKFNAGGREFTNPVQNLKVSDNDISFSAEVGGVEVRFVGKLADTKLGGTLEALEKGQRIATGAWSLTQSESVTVRDLVGLWKGTFSAQIIPAQQADPNFDARVSNPAYTKKHPKVLFDEAHNNVHTASGLYKPFVDLITNDGYVVVPNKEKFQPSTLAGYDVLVIVNAAGPRGQRTNPAFTDEECDIVRDWVQAGGALLFIADHAPMGAAAEILAKRFGVDMSKGYTDDVSSTDKVLGDILFSRENKLLANHPITNGRNSRERVNRVVTFTGQSLKGTKDSVELFMLPNTAVDTFPPNKTTTPATGRAQGIAMKFGKGRVIVLGEAGMLSAQIDNQGRAFGMNYPNTDNRQLALNIMHWLTKLLK